MRITCNGGPGFYVSLTLSWVLFLISTLTKILEVRVINPKPWREIISRCCVVRNCLVTSVIPAQTRGGIRESSSLSPPLGGLDTEEKSDNVPPGPRTKVILPPSSLPPFSPFSVPGGQGCHCSRTDSPESNGASVREQSSNRDIATKPLKPPRPVIQCPVSCVCLENLPIIHRALGSGGMVQGLGGQRRATHRLGRHGRVGNDQRYYLPDHMPSALQDIGEGVSGEAGVAFTSGFG